MYYLLILVLLFLAELFYFRIADRCNIIDKPNERSSHTKVTLRAWRMTSVMAYSQQLAQKSYMRSGAWSSVSKALPTSSFV